MAHFSLFPESQTETLTQSLNHLLADLHLHYQKMRSFHWNVYGPQFFELHSAFETRYNAALEMIDEVAERVLMLQRRPVSNFSDYLYMAAILEEKTVLRPRDMVEASIQDFRLLIQRMNETIAIANEASDAGTSDLITRFIQDVQKAHWMFGAFLRE